MITIRELQEEDLNQFPEYLRKVYSESEYMSRYADEVSSDELVIKTTRQYLNSDHSKIFCAFDDDKLVGNLSVTGVKLRKLRHSVEMGISVLEEYHRIRIATNMLALAEKWCENNQIIKINLQVVEKNFPAIKFYEKQGYIVEGRISKAMNIDGNMYDLINMGKIIKK